MRAEARALLVVAVASALAARAEAAPPAAENTAARAAFTEGERNFQLGKFDAAIEAYERAFGLDPQPAFLFNIALSHRRQYAIDGQIDHLARARELYRNYLRLEPQAPNRSGVEKLINDLTAKIDAARGKPESEPAPPVPPEPATASGVSPGPQPVPPPAAPPSPAGPPAVLASPVAPVEPPSSSKRKWLIGGTVAAAVVVGAIAVFFITRSGPSFDGPGVNLTDRP
jgi:tetratricopeptide (TPR) repeat protein